MINVDLSMHKKECSKYYTFKFISWLSNWIKPFRFFIKTKNVIVNYLNNNEKKELEIFSWMNF